MSGWGAYMAVTLIPVGVGIGLTGAMVEPTVGMLSAWAVQGIAFRRLLKALGGRRDATRAWLGGILARGGGLVALGVASFAGLAGRDLPVAYALTMFGLMLAEAAWLYRGRAKVGDNGADRHGIEGTRTTG